MKKFLYYQSIVQYRIPVNDDGTVGTPETIKQFTVPIKDTRKKKIKKEPVVKEAKQVVVEKGEEVLL